MDVHRPSFSTTLIGYTGVSGSLVALVAPVSSVSLAKECPPCCISGSHLNIFLVHGRPTANVLGMT